jgi:hypothetical protein
VEAAKSIMRYRVRVPSVTTLHLLLSPLYDGALAPAHRADLAKSGLTEETIRTHRIMSVPPDMIRHLLGFDPTGVVSAMVLPFPDPTSGWFDHVRVKIFPTLIDRDGHQVKYLGPCGMAPRLYFPIPATAVLSGMAPVWLTEGSKKALAVAQLGLPAVGFEGIEAWHTRGSTDLLPDFDLIPLAGRVVEVVADGDWQINSHVRRGVERLGAALAGRGARPRLVALPAGLAA